MAPFLVAKGPGVFAFVLVAVIVAGLYLQASHSPRPVAGVVVAFSFIYGIVAGVMWSLVDGSGWPEALTFVMSLTCLCGAAWLVWDEYGDRWRRVREVELPGSFDGMTQALQSISGARNMSTKRGGSYFTVSRRVAEQLLSLYRVKCLERGTYLFRCKRHADQLRDVLCLLPTTDVYAVIENQGTDGINYGLDNRQLIARLRELAAVHPFELDGVGYDFISGRFTATLPTPELLGRLFYPNDTDETRLQALDAQLRTPNSLYLWWD